MMRAAGAAAADAAAAEGLAKPLVIAVTVLTSLDRAALGRVGVRTPVLEQVDALAALAAEAGLEGIVASPQETSWLRERRGRGHPVELRGRAVGPATVRPRPPAGSSGRATSP